MSQRLVFNRRGVGARTESGTGAHASLWTEVERIDTDQQDSGSARHVAAGIFRLVWQVSAV